MQGNLPRMHLGVPWCEAERLAQLALCGCANRQVRLLSDAAGKMCMLQGWQASTFRRASGGCDKGGGVQVH
jgi:hypothetical protein